MLFFVSLMGLEHLELVCWLRFLSSFLLLLFKFKTPPPNCPVVASVIFRREPSHSRVEVSFASGVRGFIPSLPLNIRSCPVSSCFLPVSAAFDGCGTQYVLVGLTQSQLWSSLHTPKDSAEVVTGCGISLQVRYSFYPQSLSFH